MTPQDDGNVGFTRAAPTMRRTALSIAGSVLLLATAAGLSWYFSAGAPAPDADAAHRHGAAPAQGVAAPVALTGDRAARSGVTFAAATRAPIVREIRIVGQVTLDETRVRTISPKVEGWVEQLHVSYTGQLVAAGEPLLSIHSPMLVAAQEELLLAARLMRDVEAGSPEARESAADLLASARRRLAYWDIPASDIAAIERTGAVRRALTMRAPYGGYVLEKNVLAGQRIMMGEALYKLADLRTVWIEGEVFEQDLPSVRLGQPVVVRLDASPGRDWRGRIGYIHPTVDADTRTARIRVELSNPGMLLKPGMYATLEVDGTSRDSVLTVPRSAVLATGTRHLVFVRRDDGALEPREVTVGVTNDTRITITSGLRPGDTVAASATFLIDAESNLGSLGGGAAAMPAMAMPAPPAPPAAKAAPVSSGGVDPHAGHRE